MSASPLSGDAFRLGRNSLWLLGARVGTQGLAVLFTILLARHLGNTGFGEYAFMAAIIFIGNSLTTFGTDMLLIREIAAKDSLSRLPAALVVQLALSAVFIALVWWGGPRLPNQGQAALQALQVYSLALIPLAFYTVFTTALRGRQLMDSFTLLNLGVSGLQVAAVWYFTRQAGDLVQLAVLLLIVQVLAAGLAAAICNAQIAGFWQEWRLSPDEALSVAVASLPLGWLSLLAMFYQKFSLTVLSLLAGPAAGGWFAGAQRAVEAAKTGHLAGFTALYPAMAHAQTYQTEEKTASWATTLRLSWIVLSSLAGLAALILTLMAGPLVELLYGAGFEPAAPLLRIMAWMLVPYTLNTFLTLDFVAAGREHAVGRILLVSLAALVGLSLWWIPAAGALGAAWAALAAEGLQSVLFLAQVVLHRRVSAKRGEVHELSHLSR